MRIKRSAQKAAEIPRRLGYVSYCFHCGYHEVEKFPNRICKNCGKEADYAGPLWMGELHNKKFLEKMKEINAGRDYSDKKEIAKILDLLIGEVGMPPFYYNLHELCSRLKIGRILKIEEVIDKLRKEGFKAVRTHFDEKGIKTDASINEIAQSAFENALNDA